MAISNVQKVYLFAPRSCREELMEKLQTSELMHIESNLREEIEEATSEKEILTQEIDLEISQAEYVIDYLKKFERKLTLAQQIEKAKNQVDYDEFRSIQKKFNLKSIYREVYKLTKKSKELSSEETELLARRGRLEPYRNLKISFDTIKDTLHVRARIGSVAESQFKSLHMELVELDPAHTIYKIAESFNQRDYFFLAYHKSIEAPVEKILVGHNYREEDLNIRGTVASEFEHIDGRLEEIRKERKGITEESNLLADWLDRVKLVYDYLISIRARRQAEGHLYETHSTFIIKGWVKEQDIPRLKEAVESVTKDFHMDCSNPEKEDRVPVEMANPQFISPMEFVTSLYGTPKYGEYDPTGYLFGFFLLFFAICLTDAGYGVMLLILSLVLMKFIGDSKLLRVLLYGSVITIIAGFVSGGFWGIEYSQLPEFIQKHSINLGEKALQFLSFTLFLGIIQMVYGFILGAKLALEQKDRDTAIDKILKAVFFGCGAPVVVMSGLLNTTFPEPWQTILSKTALTAGGCFLIVNFVKVMMEYRPTGTPAQKAIAFIVTFLRAALTDSLLALINAITNFLGATLSYSRLMALGLATGGIGMVINLLAGLVSELIPIPVIAPILSIFVLVFGHTFNLIISTLGAFVHTARLQYVEFFPYFFEGGGRRFEPFAIRTKYNTVATKGI